MVQSDAVTTLPRACSSAIALTALALLAACGSSGGGAVATRTDPSASPTPRAVVAADLHGKRYCEILLLQPAGSGGVADVYNTYGLNDCPPTAWATLDMKAVATANGAPLAIRNGPRYWLMDRIDKAAAGARVVKTFGTGAGAIAMIKEATVTIGSLTGPRTYTPRNVNRATVFTWDAGRTVYELHDATGGTWLMQTYSQQIDPSLTEAGLAGLATRLHLPAGWSYRSRVLTAALRVVTTTTDARVMQDDLMNSYSHETG